MSSENFSAPSFAHRKNKRFGALILCLLIFFTILKMRLSIGAGLKMLMIRGAGHSPSIENTQQIKTDDTNSPKIDYSHERKDQNFTISDTSNKTQTSLEVTGAVRNRTEPVCNFTLRSDFCKLDGDVRIHGWYYSTIYITPSPKTDILLEENNNISSWKITPYARNEDPVAMSLARKWLITESTTQTIPECTVHHTIPALVFSVGGYTANYFHAVTDVLIPLFLTARSFNGEVQFLVSDRRAMWIDRFRNVVNKLSNYQVIDIDTDEQIHCFPSAFVGLISHTELGIDPSKPPYYSMDDFRAFLRECFSLNRPAAVKIKDGHGKKKPRLLILSRKKTRAITNEKKIAQMAKISGYQVVLAEANTNTSSLSKFARVVNSCDVMMGVHGAGLTNIIFLPDNAVFIQVVPLGKMEVLSRYDFGDPSKAMRLSYLEYSINDNESSLINEYPPDHDVFKNPYSIQGQGWVSFRTIYLDKQNVQLDAQRFRPILFKAIELLHHNDTV